MPTRRVKTAHPAGEDPFPAVPVDYGKDLIRVYDLTALLPVLRTFAAGQLKLEDRSKWGHAAATRIYSDDELGAIVGYLRSR